jgi:3-hydroxybutyryl-CoA dehydrogenase
MAKGYEGSRSEDGLMHKAQNGYAAIIGGGTMGADVALIFAAGGWATHVVEPSDATRAGLPRYLAAGLRQMGSEHRGESVKIHGALEDAPWESIEVVVECIPEKLELKRKLFVQLERLSRPDALLTSNSSSFPISEIAAGLATSRRMLGLHFFMPAHLVPLVEVVRSEASEPELAETIGKVMRSLGKVPVQVKKDVPGFLANRMQHALAREAFALIDSGVATPADVDAAVRFGFGFRFLAAGPCLQRDHAGLDVHCAAAATMYPTFANNSEPALILRNKVQAGHLGMKTGKGFFEWGEESIKREKARYEGLLQAGLELLKDELPKRGKSQDFSD